MSRYTFKEFQADFPDDNACLAKLMEIRFGGTELTCPNCRKHTSFHPMTKRKAFACQECGHHIYPCANTIFHKSSTKLTHWFFAMYLMTSTRHGVAAKEIQRQVGVTYKTAWRMCHELRKLMANADHDGMLGGHVEIDDTAVGGRQSREDRDAKGTNKTIVMGMVSREGKIIAGPIPAATTEIMAPIVRQNVEKGSTVTTDKALAFGTLRFTYDHHTVDHDAKEWARGTFHTNTIEGHWSHFKRSIKGTHVHISSKHMWKYVSEFSYRRNFRHSHAIMFNRLVAAFSLPRLVET